MRKFFVLFLLLTPLFLSAQSFESQLSFDLNSKFQFSASKKPPLKLSTIAGETFVGLAFGYISAVTLKPKDEGLSTLFASPFRVFGIFAGVTGGVYLMGNLDRETGNIAATAGGAILSGFIFGEIGQMDSALSIEDIIYRFVVPGAVVGAVFGFNLTRKYKRKKSVFNFYDNSFEIGVPDIKVNKHLNDFVYQLSLVNIVIN